MPELAEVEYYRRQWLPFLGQTVAAVQLNASKRVFRGEDTVKLQHGLVGQRFSRSEGHGKQMLFVFGETQWMGIHLGMTGKTKSEGPGYVPEKHDHLIVALESGHSLVLSDSRMFGRVRYHQGGALPDWWSGLPSQILSNEFTVEKLHQFLGRRSRSPIKAVLLMQERFPGVGNWMADEILWRARIRPDLKAGEIQTEQRLKLYETLIEVCQDAMRVIAPDWSKPPDDWLFNHRWKDGGSCPKTGGKLIREQIGGRTTCWSPEWQG